MKYVFAALHLTLLLNLNSCGHGPSREIRRLASMQENGAIEGIWSLQGTHSRRGPYNGELELRKANDGTLDVVRIVTYIQFYHEGFRVQEVWTGKALADASGLVINYNLKQADYITRLGPLKRDPAAFKNHLNILVRFRDSAKGPETHYSVMEEDQYQEWIGQRRELTEKPLWADERTKLDAQGPPIPWVVRGVIKAFKYKIGYEKDPLVKAYKDRPEYKNEKPSLIFDPTDYDFYQTHKEILRVTNKITDPISLAEVMVKRNAYSPSYEEKAEGYEKNMQDRHINAAGMYMAVQLDPQENVVHEIPEGDSTLWTGMYIGSQAMRYKVTQDPAALQNVRRSLRALFLLMDIPQDPKEFARTVTPYDPSRQLGRKWRRGEGPYAGWMWMEGGNNDMVKGLTHAFLWAGLVLPESDTLLWKELREKSRRLIDLKVVAEKPQNRPAALGLAALLNQDSKLREEYLQSHKSLRVRASGYSFDTHFYWHGSADWSGINLGMVGNITHVLLAEALNAPKVRDQWRERMMDEWLVFRPSRRPMQTLATFGFSYRHGVRGEKFKKSSSEAEFQAALKHSLWGLREIPFPRPTHWDVSVDHSLTREWSMSPIPRLFWKAAKRPMPPVEYFYQGLYDYPLFQQDAFDSTFLWKSAGFNYRISHQAGVEYGGIDYLYAYWLSRYSGVVFE